MRKRWSEWLFWIGRVWCVGKRGLVVMLFELFELLVVVGKFDSSLFCHPRKEVE